MAGLRAERFNAEGPVAGKVDALHVPAMTLVIVDREVLGGTVVQDW